MANPPRKVVQHRSAKTGEFVTEKYAQRHKDTTVREVNKIPPKPKGK